MATKNQQNTTKQKRNNFDNKVRNILVFYIDSITRGLISLVFMILIIYAVRFYFPNIPYWYFLPIAFVLSLAISPLLIKVKIGHIFADKYIALINNIVYKLNRSSY